MRPLPYGRNIASERFAMRPSGRQRDELRPVSIETGVLTHAEGSCLIACGDTRVICAASVSNRLPLFRRGTGLGWVTAEYAMLPRATDTRSRRESMSGRPSGRSLEIQRLIGRSLRSCVDFATLGERQIVVDCDVINADGGTRCASITGGWVALRLACSWLMDQKTVRDDPLTGHVAAVSCGMFAGSSVLDLDYSEDSNADVDANFVLNGSGALIELQCSSELAPFTEESLAELLTLARQGTDELFGRQRAATGG